MEFAILGPLRVCSASGVLPLLGRKRRQVLAALLLAPNQTVTMSRLIDAVWDDSPPATAKRQIQNCISALRQDLSISGDGPGYRICLAPGRLDAQVFQERVGCAKACVVNGQIDEAVILLRSALSLWRGRSLEGCDGRLIEAAAARLDEERLGAMERCFDLELQLGRHHELAGEITEVVVAHPLRERLVGQLMLALHGSGRQSEALAAYQQLRADLADNLGIDPSAPLQQLHTAILRQDAVPAAASATERQHDLLKIPRQLPTVTRHFVGRSSELKELTQLMDQAGDERAMAISVIAGTAGVGKTAFALHWAHQVVARFPDGQLYVNLRGFDPTGSPMTPAEAIRGFLDAFGVPVAGMPGSVEAQAALYRSLVAQRRVLVVLDNAADVGQVRPLLPGGVGCLVLVTSRNQLTGLLAAEGARPLILDVLSTAEAQELLTRQLGQQRLAGQQHAVNQLITQCANLPLALSIVAARVAVQPAFALSTFVTELSDMRDRLDALDTGDQATALPAVLSWSYQQLPPTTAKLFRQLGLHPGPDISLPATASLAAIPIGRTRRLLGQLTQANLVSEHIPGRFTFHELLRAYAAELAEACDSKTERTTAIHRILDHYLHTAHVADKLIHPSREPNTLDQPHTGVVAETLADHPQALSWFTAEHRTLLAAIRQSAQLGFSRHTWQLTRAIGHFLDWQGHWAEHTAALEDALQVSRRTADTHGEAIASRALARTFTRVGDFERALKHFMRALDLFGKLGEPAIQAHTHLGLAHMFERQGRPADALPHALQAHGLYQQTEHRTGPANALNAVGMCHSMLGNHELAIAYCQQALQIQQQIADRYGEACTCDSLGQAHHHLGQHAMAAQYLQRAVDLFYELGDRYNEARSLQRLGDSHHAMGDVDAAHSAREHAAAIHDQLGQPMPTTSTEQRMRSSIGDMRVQT